MGRERVYLYEVRAVLRWKRSMGLNILGKCPRKSLLAANFLASDEGINSNCNGTIDILRRAVIGKAHLAECFGDTHDRFQVTDLVMLVS